MHLLKQINILGLTFDVEYCDFDNRLQMNGYTGNSWNMKQKLQIDTGASVEHQKVTLLHEILHMISDNLALELTRRQ